MDDRIRLHLDQRGLVSRPELIAAGYDDRDISAARRGGILERIGTGIYADPATTALWTPEQKHAVQSRALQRRLGPSAVVSHQSAAVLHGIDTWGMDLSMVQVTRRSTGRARSEAGLHHHLGELGDEHVTSLADGTLLTTPARAVWECVCATDGEHGMALTDSALRQHLVTHEDLLALRRQFAYWPGSRTARLALSPADGRAESVGESRSLYLFWRYGVPTPELQVEIFDEGAHVPFARADFGWIEARHLAEFDGRVKYVGEDGAGVTALLKEKEREDRIRAQGWGISRIVWADLHPSRSRQTAQRLRADIDRSSATATRGRTIIA